ncbi:MAG: hypothetical protein ACK4I8_00480 [Armatimonadota bacterium]
MSDKSAQSQSLKQPRNLLRNSHFWFSSNGEIPDWWGTGAPERIPNWGSCISLEEDSPIPDTRALRLFNPQNGTWFIIQSFAHFLPSGKPYTFSVYLRADRDESPVMLSIGYDKSTVVKASTKWQRFTFTATPRRGHWRRGRLAVSIAFIQAGNLWVAAPQLEEGEIATDYNPLHHDDVYLFSHPTSFRAIVQFNAYRDEPTMRVWCESNLPETVKVRCKANGMELQPKGDTTLKGWERKFVSFQIDNLSEGTYDLIVEALDEQGKLVATASDTLVKLSLNENVGTFVQIDRVRRHLVINGRPTIVFAQGIHANPEVWWLDDIAEHGFNTVIPADSATWEQMRRFLDNAYKRNLWVIAWLRPSGKTAQEIADEIVKTITDFRDHPAIIAWYLLDEPEDWWKQGGRKEEDLVMVYQAAKQADPYRPSQLNWYKWEDGKGGYGSLKASDFGSLDHYPFGKVENPFEPLSDFLWRMNRDCRPLGKPVAFWQQMYGYDDAIREPTPEEARTHTWLTIVTGGRLIYWFIYKPMGKELWESMPKIANEVKQLESLLTADDATELAVGRENNVHYAVWRIDGKEILLLVNAGYTTANTPIFARWLTGREVKIVKQLIGDGNVTVRNGLVWAQMPPLAAGAFSLE